MGDSALHAVAGSAGGSMAMALTYPLVNLSTRAAVQSKQEETPLHLTARRIIRDEGLSSLYSGLSSSLIGVAATNGVYYACYEKLRSILLRRHRSPSSSASALTSAEAILAGLIAGSFTSLATNPIWTIQTAQSTQSVSSKTSGEKPDRESMWLAGKRIYDKDGLRGFWRGFGPALLLVVNPVIQYTIFERLLSIILALRKSKDGGPTTRSSLSDWHFFMLGAVSKLVATWSTYPIIVVKSRLQAATHRYKSTLAAILHILKNEGIEGLYAGLLPKLLQSVLTAAIMFAAQRRIYETLRKVVTGVSAPLQ